MKITCSICLESFDFSQQDISATNCGHLFHKSCLESWNRENSSCPECRKVIYGGSIVKKLYPNVTEEEEDYISIALQQLNLNFQTSINSFEAEKLRLLSDLIKSEVDRVRLSREITYLREKVSKTKTANNSGQSQIEQNEFQSKYSKSIVKTFYTEFL